MGCPPVREDNPRALISRLSCVQVDDHGITILLYITRYFVLKLVHFKDGISVKIWCLLNLNVAMVTKLSANIRLKTETGYFKTI